MSDLCVMTSDLWLTNFALWEAFVDLCVMTPCLRGLYVDDLGYAGIRADLCFLR